MLDTASPTPSTNTLKRLIRRSRRLQRHTARELLRHTARELLRPCPAELRLERVIQVQRALNEWTDLELEIAILGESA